MTTEWKQTVDKANVAVAHMLMATDLDMPYNEALRLATMFNAASHACVKIKCSPQPPTSSASSDGDPPETSDR